MEFIHFKALNRRTSKPVLSKRSQSNFELNCKENQYIKTLTLVCEGSSPNSHTRCYLKVLKLVPSKVACYFIKQA